MMKRQNIRTLFLIIGTFTYLLCGASFFDYAESRHEKHERTALKTIEEMIINKYNITTTDFRILTTIIIKSVPHKAGVQWKFSGAFYFATTVLTTIGYGHSTPATYVGKAFCMIYALIGIPLGLIMFQSIGERLNTFVAYSLRFCKRCLHFKKAENKDTNSIPLSDKCLIISVTIISTLVMTIGAGVFSHWENWSYFDAFYYCFITLTTIGFGDYVALQKNSALQDKPEYVIFSLVFILFGLSVVSAAINLMVLRFLTMNTEDEKRDEAEAALVASSGVRLEGDVITANGSMISGIMPIENHLHTLHNTHNSVYPFTGSRYHVYSYQPNIKQQQYLSKFSSRTNRLEKDELLSDQEYLDAEELEIASREQADELMETDTNSSQLNRALYQKQQILISDSGSERTFNTVKHFGTNLAYLSNLKAHNNNSGQSELSFSSSRQSQRKAKRRSRKVFCKTSNSLLGKQQRKNYKHMISDDSESEAEVNSEIMSESVQLQTDDYINRDDDQASVCSCTCYGNNSSQAWSKKNKKSKKSNELDLSKNGQQTFILNRRSPSSKRNFKTQSASKPSTRPSNLKTKMLSYKSTRPNKDTHFNLDQMNQLGRLNQLNQFNQMQNLETILRPQYYQQSQQQQLSRLMNPLTNEQLAANNVHPNSIFPLNMLNLNNLNMNNITNLEQQQILNSANDALMILNDQVQRPFMVMQHQPNQQQNQFSNHENLHDQFICNVDTNLSNLSNSDHVLNQLNATKKNMSYFVADEKGLSASQLNYLTKDEKGQIIELNEQRGDKKLRTKSKTKDFKKSKTNYQTTDRLSAKAFEKDGSSEQLIKRSNEGNLEGFLIDDHDEQIKQTQFLDAQKVDTQNEKTDTKSEFLSMSPDNLKSSSQRASI